MGRKRKLLRRKGKTMKKTNGEIGVAVSGLFSGSMLRARLQAESLLGLAVDFAQVGLNHFAEAFFRDAQHQEALASRIAEWIAE